MWDLVSLTTDAAILTSHGMEERMGGWRDMLEDKTNHPRQAQTPRVAP